MTNAEESVHMSNRLNGPPQSWQVGERVECYHLREPERVLWRGVVTRLARAGQAAIEKTDGGVRRICCRGQVYGPFGPCPALRVRRAT